MFLTKTRKVQTRWLTGFSETGTNYFLLYERERGHSCSLDVFSPLCLLASHALPHSAVFTFDRPHPIYPDRKREREREMSHSHIIHFSLKDTRIWSSLLVRPIDQSETTHNVLTKQCPHRCTHKTQYKGVGRRKQTLTQSVVFSLRILIDLSE